MKKITYPLIYAGKKQQFARSVVVGNLVFVSGSSGRWRPGMCRRTSSSIR